MVDWPYYGANAYAQHYSPLDQIDAANVARLRVVWRWSAANFGPRPEARSQVTPIMVNGVLYATAGTTRNIVAIDARTGQTLWLWRPDEGERFDASPRKLSGRGVAYWDDGGDDRRIFTTTPGFHLAALDADTGLPVTGFGDNGVVDMLPLLRGPDDNIIITATSPPLVVNDVIVVGPAHGVGARPNSKTQTKGDVRGFDVRSGELLWTFHSNPAAGEFGADTWLVGSAEYSGNAGAWGALAAGAERGMVYLAVEAARGGW
jgi:quinoprotein glucose dehydrogenase